MAGSDVFPGRANVPVTGDTQVGGSSGMPFSTSAAMSSTVLPSVSWRTWSACGSSPAFYRTNPAAPAGTGPASWNAYAIAVTGTGSAVPVAPVAPVVAVSPSDPLRPLAPV